VSNSGNRRGALGTNPRQTNAPPHPGHFNVGFSIGGLAATVKTYNMFNVTVTNIDNHSQFVLARG